MFLIDIFRNYINQIAGRRQEFFDLLAARDITAVKDKMISHALDAKEALDEYNTATHRVMKLPPKIITDKKGNFVKKEEPWRLAVPYPAYINEIALVFLYGNPVKWHMLSEGTDRAFARFQEVIKATRFDSKVRQCKRIAGAETESAMLFRVFRGDDGKPDVQIRVLANSKGDEIYTRWDEYENLVSVAWGYYIRETGNDVVYHFDIFTDKTTYRCVKRPLGWEVAEETNLIGKIPVILFQQKKEWEGVESLINREEMIASRNADTNDYFADPIMVVAQDVIKNLPEKTSVGKLLRTTDRDGVANAARYLTWDAASQSKKDEIEWLQDQILNKSFTPKISLDTLKSLGNLSAKALRTVMLLADIKASRHKERHDELLDRTASLLGAIIGNVLDVGLAEECSRLSVGHEFQDPFGEDVKDDLDNLVKAVDAGLVSKATAVELCPLVKDVGREKERLAAEREEREASEAEAEAEAGGARPAYAGGGEALGLN